MRLENKIAVVTGGSRGIGRAVCVQLAKDLDYPIIINYNSNKAAAEETLKLVEEAGGKGELMPFNVTDVDAVKSALE